jgi:hypothetical protein
MRQVPGAAYVDAPLSKTQTRRNRRAPSPLSSMISWPPLGGASEVPSPGCSIDEVPAPLPAVDAASNATNINSLPNEVLYAILEEVEKYEGLVNFARAWPRLSKLIADFNIMHQRDLQCFALKKTYHEVRLGVGISHDPRQGLSSEFDFLSREAYLDLDIRQSIHHIPFQWWLPLPLSERHWRLVKTDAYQTLDKLTSLIKVSSPSRADVLFAFMTDIVVKLNLVELPPSDAGAVPARAAAGPPRAARAGARRAVCATRCAALGGRGAARGRGPPAARRGRLPAVPARDGRGARAVGGQLHGRAAPDAARQRRARLLALGAAAEGRAGPAHVARVARRAPARAARPVREPLCHGQAAQGARGPAQLLPPEGECDGGPESEAGVRGTPLQTGMLLEFLAEEMARRALSWVKLDRLITRM